MSTVEQEQSVVRSEEELHVGARLGDVGRVLVRKLVGTRVDGQDVDLEVEQAEVETTAAEEGDTGEVLTLPDGSLSVPVFEERVFVEKRMVVRERIVIRKHTVSRTERVEADVRVERVEVTADHEVRDRLDAAPGAQELIRSSAAPRTEEAPVETPIPTPVRAAAHGTRRAKASRST